MTSDFVSAEVFLVLMQWRDVHKRLLALRKIRRPTTTQPMVKQTPRKTTSQIVSTNSCVRETLPGVNALLEEPLIT